MRALRRDTTAEATAAAAAQTRALAAAVEGLGADLARAVGEGGAAAGKRDDATRAVLRAEVRGGHESV